jgi:alpha-tubulin suppressor-like RCC1 family protein
MTFKPIQTPKTETVSNGGVIDFCNGTWGTVVQDGSYLLWSYGPPWQSGAGGALDPILENSVQFLPVFTPTKFVKLMRSNNNTTFALDESSYLWAWGVDSTGSFGLNLPIASATIPVRVGGNKQWWKVSVGQSHVLALDSSSFLWSWGGNSSGMLGLNNAVNKSSPVSVGRQGIDVKCGHDSSYLLDTSSYLWAWGANTSGKLGDNTALSRSSPVSVVGGRKFIALMDDGWFSTSANFFAIDESSNLWGWGQNSNGSLGDNTQSQRSSPVSVVGNIKWKSVQQLAQTATLGIDISDNVYIWGNRALFQYESPAIYSSPVITNIFKNPVKIRACDGQIGYIDNKSILWVRGSNSSGQLGTGNNTAISTDFIQTKFIPQTSYTLASFPQAAKQLFITGHGNGGYILDTSSVLWQFGTYAFSSPTFLMSNIKKIHVGYTTNSAIDGNDDLWVWGGRPAKLQTSKKWIDVHRQRSTSYALDTSSYLWSWGSNTYGQLGDGTTTDRSVPTSVLTGQVKSFCTNGYTLWFTDFSDFLWSVGQNNMGQCGNLTITNKSSPVSVFGGIKFKVLSYSDSTFVGLNDSSYAWAFGSSGSGDLGDGSFTSKSSPVSVIGNRQFIKLSTSGINGLGTNATVAALDGSSYAWYWGLYGSLNSGGVVSPTSVIGGYKWKDVGFWNNVYSQYQVFYGLLNDNEIGMTGGQYNNLFPNGLVVTTSLLNNSSPLVMTYRNWSVPLMTTMTSKKYTNIL